MHCVRVSILCVVCVESLVTLGSGSCAEIAVCVV